MLILLSLLSSRFVSSRRDSMWLLFIWRYLYGIQCKQKSHDVSQMGFSLCCSFYWMSKPIGRKNVFDQINMDWMKNWYPVMRRKCPSSMTRWFMTSFLHMKTPHSLLIVEWVKSVILLQQRDTLWWILSQNCFTLPRDRYWMTRQTIALKDQTSDSIVLNECFFNVLWITYAFRLCEMSSF